MQTDMSSSWSCITTKKKDERVRLKLQLSFQSGTLVNSESESSWKLSWNSLKQLYPLNLFFFGCYGAARGLGGYWGLWGVIGDYRGQIGGGSIRKQFYTLHLLFRLGVIIVTLAHPFYKVKNIEKKIRLYLYFHS